MKFTSKYPKHSIWNDEVKINFDMGKYETEDLKEIEVLKNNSDVKVIEDIKEVKVIKDELIENKDLFNIDTKEEKVITKKKTKSL